MPLHVRLRTPLTTSHLDIHPAPATITATAAASSFGSNPLYQSHLQPPRPPHPSTAETAALKLPSAAPTSTPERNGVPWSPPHPSGTPGGAWGPSPTTSRSSRSAGRVWRCIRAGTAVFCGMCLCESCPWMVSDRTSFRRQALPAPTNRRRIHGRRLL